MCLNLKTGVELCSGDFVEDIVSATVISAAAGEEKQGEEGRGLKVHSQSDKGSGGINEDKVNN